MDQETMSSLANLLENNNQWSKSIREEKPGFFEQLSEQQAPKYLWIGCADSRVPANEIVGLLPGELFVHRNVANVVVHTDLNCLSVLQYAVDYLKVEHIIVTGHYGCGGVREAMNNSKLGLIDNWLRHVQDVKKKHTELLENAGSDDDQFQRMCELNVLEQVLNVCQTTIVQDAWDRGQKLTVNSWVYGLKDGLVRDLGLSVGSNEDIEVQYPAAIESIASKLEG
ncbi:carbonate dehydratase [Thalassotalea sp. G20_0]|uniref:carbonate dehydratase n=1 Tax=Thalassotalea sp. G20_0 TaxID=2821093 RepID=UPI0025702299|nr:carbonate dehydratase [Thalassotalea sp. G20_0]